MFFSKKKKGNVVEILAPVDGDAVPLEDVRDQVIAQGLMGEGIAIDPMKQCLRLVREKSRISVSRSM